MKDKLRELAELDEVACIPANRPNLYACGWNDFRAIVIAILDAEGDGVAVDFPECSGDPSSCPENEGHGCCKVPSHDPTGGMGLSRFQAQFDDGDDE